MPMAAMSEIQPSFRGFELSEIMDILKKLNDYWAACR